MIGRIVGSAWGASLAWFIGKALNVPVWRDWPVGDRTDMAVAAFLTCFLLSRPRKTGG